MPHDDVNDGEQITITAFFGEEHVIVKIYYSRNGGGVWMICLNGFYHGRVWHTENFGWQNDIHATSPLSIDDIETIKELIAQRVGPPSV